MQNQTQEKPIQGTGRPKGGYRNAAGKRVPGVTTILSRFKESGGLVQWAYQCGCDGIDINDARDRAADAGTCCHDRIDAHLHGRTLDDNSYPKDIMAKADHAFIAFLEWQAQTKLSLTASEVSLVSEKHQFGGTFDAGFMQDGKSLRILDYKTSSGIYTDHLVQVAGGYTLLWQEHFPKQEIHGIDILRISKPSAPDDPVSFEHRHFSAELIPICQRYFLLLREAYDMDKRIKGLL